MNRVNFLMACTFSILSLIASSAVTETVYAKPLVLDKAYQGPVKLEISQLGLAFKLKGSLPQAEKGLSLPMVMGYR